IVAVGLLALDHGEHPQRKPFLLLARLGLPARVGDGYGLLGVLLLGANRIAVDVDGVAFVDDIRAIVVVNRFGGIAAEGGAPAPGGRAPDEPRGGPAGGPPGTWIPTPPVAVEAVVVAKVIAYHSSLVDQRLPANGPCIGIPRDHIGPGNLTQAS